MDSKLVSVDQVKRWHSDLVWHRNPYAMAECSHCKTQTVDLQAGHQ